MDDRPAIAWTGREPEKEDACAQPFLLCELQVGQKDKLGNRVEEILWVGRNYKIYRSEKAVYVHFSDNPEQESDQRARFTEICPELCELRYLTAEMRASWRLTARPRGSLFDHNIAQAIMLILEGKIDAGKQIAREALNMAVRRVTNDNTIRYFVFCTFSWIVAIIIGSVLFYISSGVWWPYLVAGMAGATGAVLSIATRIQTFELRPCDQSNMNYWMSSIRVGIGFIAGIILLLLAPTIMSDAMKGLVPHMEASGIEWQAAVTLGLLGGFAERFIPNILRRTIGNLERSIGTPVQAVRGQEVVGGSQSVAHQKNA